MAHFVTRMIGSQFPRATPGGNSEFSGPRILTAVRKFAPFANAVLITGATVALLALGRDVFASGGSGLHQLTSSPASGDASLMLASVAALFLASLGLQPAPRLAVAVVSLSVTAVLYGAELMLHNQALGPQANVPFWGIDRASPQKKAEMAALVAKSGGMFDTRDRTEFLAASRSRGVDLVPAVMLADLLNADGTQGAGETDAETLFPLGGISNTATLLCNESGQFVSYHSDEHGFRNPGGIWNSARADIAAVGQSFAEGYCLPDGEGFVDLLRTPNRVVLNLGVSGESSLLQLAAIKEYLPRYAPKIVLWVFSEEIDIPDLYTESTHPFLVRYLESAFSQRLLDRQPEIDHALRRAVADIEARGRQAISTSVRSPSFVERSAAILKLWRLRQKMELVYGLNRGDPQVSSMLDRTSHNLLSDTLEQARTAASSWGGALYFVYLPSWDRYRNGPRVAEREHTRVLSIVKALHIPVIDVQPAFQAQTDPLSLFPFRRSGHYTEQGNRVVAETILGSLSGLNQ